jgi:hypothetical protein
MFGAALFILLLVGILIFTLVNQPAPNAPKYVALNTPPSGQFKIANFDWSADAPFQDGKVWIFSILSRTNFREFLFDIEKRKVVGELLNGGAVFGNRDRTKLLCEGRTGLDGSLKSGLVTLLSKISLGRIQIPTNRTESYWILDLRNNSARRVGGLSQAPGAGSRWHPSPDFRFGYNIPTILKRGSSFFLCDLENETFREILCAGDLHGWWDDRHVLVKESGGDLVLYDVITRKTNTLLDHETLARGLRGFGITNDPATLTTFSAWNGTNYDFNLIPGDRGRYTNTSFLIKLHRPGPSLTMVKHDFQLRWLGQFNAAGTCYVYPGESGPSGRGGNGAIYVLDMLTGKTTTLVPPDNKSQYALPRFYGDTVIYQYNHEIRTVNLDGSGSVRLFPPPEQ